jgi:REP element-mobilizing transposase RayT
LGIIADVLWHEIKHHTKNIELHEFTIMPNHIHGIIEIIDIDVKNVETLHRRGVACNAPTPPQYNTPTPPHGTPTDKNEYMSFISPKSGTLSAIIRSYKSAVSKHAHRLGFDFAWQRNYHENIIRDMNNYYKISEYIINNASLWQTDKFYGIENVMRT